MTKMIQRLQNSVFLEEYPAIKPIRQGLLELITSKDASRNGKDVIDLLENPLLGLRHPEEDYDECDHIEASIQAESAQNAERGQDLREGDR